VSANSGVELDAQACLYSPATCINPVVATDNAKWLICVDTVYNHFSDSLTTDAKADLREVVEVGGSGGFPGGWVLASTRRETVKRHCGAGGGGGGV